MYTILSRALPDAAQKEAITDCILIDFNLLKKQAAQQKHPWAAALKQCQALLPTKLSTDFVGK
ncbi:MAG TPA: hypothetical protein VFW59_07665 [Gallionella sp.]|nr:hypothetical protein [Gallionella sp.]